MTSTLPARVLDYDYDPQGRVSQVASPNGAASYTYSLTGTLESKTVGSDTTSYVYDAFGSLLTVVDATGTVIDYAVDPHGRRIGKLVDSVPAKSWLYGDSLRPVAELDDAGNITYAANGSALAT
ncbi:MAG: hypothetical protein AAB426_09730 [Myxococcota bacterium]